MIRFSEEIKTKLEENFQKVGTDLFINSGVYYFIVNSGKRKYDPRDIDNYIDMNNSTAPLKDGETLFLSSASDKYFFDLQVVATGKIFNKKAIILHTT